MGSIWVLSAPSAPHVGPWNLWSGAYVLFLRNWTYFLPIFFQCSEQKALCKFTDEIPTDRRKCVTLNQSFTYRMHSYHWNASWFEPFVIQSLHIWMFLTKRDVMKLFYTIFHQSYLCGTCCRIIVMISYGRSHQPQHKILWNVLGFSLPMSIQSIWSIDVYFI